MTTNCTREDLAEMTYFKSGNFSAKTIVTPCDFSDRFFCIHASSLREFQSGKIEKVSRESQPTDRIVEP